MKICFPVKPVHEGGGNYFIMSFIKYLKGHDFTITHDINDRYDVIFTNHWSVPLRSIYRGIRRNPKLRLVQRIDGAAQDYGRDPASDTKQHEVNLMTDLTIFQSQYARDATRRKFPVIVNDGPVIHNPVDFTMFTPQGPVHPAITDFNFDTLLCSVTWSTNAKKGSAEVYEVATAHPEVGFVLCGNFPGAPSLPNILQLGVLDRSALASAMRACTSFLTFSENDACPNVVLEAMSSGLPVLYKDSGGTPELVDECGIPVEVVGFAKALTQLANNKERWSANARARAESHFNPEKILGQYVEAIRNAVEASSVVPMWRKLGLAWNPYQVLLYNGRIWGKRTKELVRSTSL